VVLVFFLVSASWLCQRAPSFICVGNLGNLRRFEFGWRQVRQARVRPYLVVVAPPLLDADLRIDAIAKPLQA
jgi:hypothetical protein